MTNKRKQFFKLSLKCFHFAGLFSFFLFFQVLTGQAEQVYSMRQITNSNGLSNSSVNKVFQDSEDLVWIGTWDGLNLYNGSDFTVFHPKLNNPNCISNQVVLDITEDWQGRIWINTNHGINRYDKKSNQFTRYYFSRKNISPTSEYEFHIARGDSGIVFCAAKDWGIGYARNDSILLLHRVGKGNPVKKMIFFPPSSLMVQYVSGELEKLTLDFSEDKTVRLKSVDPVLKGVSDFIVHPDRGLFVLFNDGTLCRYSEKEKDKLTVVLRDVNRITGSIKEGILVRKGTEILLAGSEKSADTPSWLEAVKNKKITAVYEGNEQITWIGTDGEGLFKIYPQNKVFGLTTQSEISSLGGGIVRAFCETPDSSLWIGTKGNGLIRLENSRDGTHQTYNAGNSELNSSVFSLFYGQDHILYIGTDDEPALFDFKTQKFIYWHEIEGRPPADPFKSTYAIYQDNDGVVWLGTNGFGLVRFKLQRKGTKMVLSHYKRYLAEGSDEGLISSNIIFSIVPEDDSLLWLGTRLGGLNLFNKKSGRSVPFRANEKDFRSLSSNDILCMHRDQENNLWIGTSLGLNQLVSHDLYGNATFKHFTVPDGLPNNTIHGIVSDNDGNVWVSTNLGLSRFKPSGGQFQNYSEFDGLQDNEFADGAYYYGNKGLIFMGGINGFNFFDPAQISEYEHVPLLSISEIKAQHQSEPLYHQHVISQDMINPAEVILKHNQNFFNIKLAVLSYINTEKCQYAYKLNNFDNDWNYIQTRRDISFTNVPPGEYELYLKWTNCDGVWSEAVQAVNFEVKPIFWRSRYAVTLYAFFTMLLVLLILNYFKKRNLLRQNQLLLQKEEEIHQTRLTFFTNIAHEFQTPLTLIISPVQKLIESAAVSPEDQKFIKMIQRNTNRLLFLIQQLLEFRKAENLHLEIKVDRFNIVSLIEQISELFDELAIRKKIEYHIESPREIMGWFDQDKIEKILFNLLSNAFKYTPEGGKITLAAEFLQEEKIKISLSNTGKGIPKQKLSRLFERFFITTDQEHAGPDQFRTGIGLAYTKSLVTTLNGTLEVESVENEQTIFRITLPCCQNNPEENLPGEPVSGVMVSNHLKNMLDEPELPGDAVHEKIKTIEALENDKKTILIVEDEQDIHALLGELLKEKYRIVNANNGLEALRLIEKQVPDLIISDIMMPLMDGIELCSAVKSDLKFCHIPVILLTAKSSVVHRIEGLESGANSYIPKPFHPRHLEVRIEKLLEERDRIYRHFTRDSDFQDISRLPIDETDKLFIEKVIKIIAQNINNPDLQADLLEKELGMSSTNFYRKLKQISGLSPGDMIRTIRLKHAAELLRQTTMNVTEVFYESGFNNRSYFYREFQKMYQLPPKQYQLKYNKKTLLN